MQFPLGLHKTCVSFSLLLLLTGSAFAQSYDSSDVPFQVTTVVMEETEAVTQRIAMDMLIDVLESRGAYQDEKKGWLFLIGVSVEDDLDQVALSITTMQKLPEPIVQMGKESEAFYMNVSLDERSAFAPEGREIREYVSEEYMRQFAEVQGLYVEQVPKSALKEGIEAIVDRFFERHYSVMED